MTEKMSLAERRLLRDLRAAKRTRQQLLKNPASPTNDVAQNAWDRAVVAMVIRFCEQDKE